MGENFKILLRMSLIPSLLFIHTLPVTLHYLHFGLYLLSNKNLFFYPNGMNWNYSTKCLHFYLWNILSIYCAFFSHPFSLRSSPLFFFLNPLVSTFLLLPGIQWLHSLLVVFSHISLLLGNNIMLMFLFLSLCPLLFYLLSSQVIPSWSFAW